MAVTDQKIARDAKTALKPITAALISAVSQTDRPFFLHKPGYSFKLEKLSGYALAIAGAISFDAVICPDSAIIKAGAITVHSTPEQLALALSRYLVGGRVVEKAAATGITFTAAHVVSANKYGVILLQISNAGAVSSKVPAATQAYDTSGAALAALPAADSGKLAIGYILIANNAGDWTANTDDLTDGSDVTTATITTLAAVARVLSAGKAFVAGEAGVGSLAAAVSALLGSKDDNLVLLYTSDGTGAVTNGQVTAQIRPAPMNGETFSSF